MKTKRNRLYAGFAAVTVVAVGLTGCAVQTAETHIATTATSENYLEMSDNSDFEATMPIEATAQELSVMIYTNQDTGLITKYVDSSGEVPFEASYSEDDDLVKDPPSGAQNSTLFFEDIAEVEGKPYKVISTIDWTMTTEKTALIEFYNANIADKFDFSHYFILDTSLEGLIDAYINIKITDGRASGEIPKVQYELTGKSSTIADAHVADEWLARTPAWSAYDKINGHSVGADQYHYSFDCSTYGVVANSDELINAAKAMFSAVKPEFRLSSSSTTVPVETTLPCEVLYDGPESQSGSQSFGPDEGVTELKG